MTKMARLFTFLFSAVLIFGLVGCGSEPRKSSTGEYFDDTVITTKVKTAILADEELKSTEINVETFKGIVQLSGFVKNPAHIDRATSVARSVEGVKSIRNNINVK